MSVFFIATVSHYWMVKHHISHSITIQSPTNHHSMTIKLYIPLIPIICRASYEAHFFTIRYHLYQIYILVGGSNPSEKYEFVNWDDDIPNINGKIKVMFQSPPTSIVGSNPVKPQVSYGFPMVFLWFTVQLSNMDPAKSP